ncbi:hypothetical protein Q3G72_033454 [Acer saccharum]|nr:hypothetical protein Q3G72_033454 [Acer saccharum]
MDQWKRELSKLVRTRDSFTVTTLHGSGRSHTLWSKIVGGADSSYQYGTLASELKRKVLWEEKLKISVTTSSRRRTNVLCSMTRPSFIGTKKSEIDGKPILNLPEKHTIENRAIFKEDELNFYKALETQSRIQFNKFVKNGSIGQNYSKALVLLLRLRQCCCSPQLVINSADFVIIAAGVEGTDAVANAKELGEDVVNRVKAAEEFWNESLRRRPVQEESDHDDNDDDDSDTVSESDVTEDDGSDDGDDLKDFIVDDDESLEAEDSDLDEDDLDHIKKPKPTKSFN